MNSAIGLEISLHLSSLIENGKVFFGPSSTGCLDGAIYSIMGYFIEDNNK